jgi:hypothetical protein
MKLIHSPSCTLCPSQRCAAHGPAPRRVARLVAQQRGLAALAARGPSRARQALLQPSREVGPRPTRQHSTPTS